MITCRQLIDFIGAYVADELDAASRESFELHLERCRSCRAYLATYRETIFFARALATEAPADDVPEELIRTILGLR